MSDRPLLMPEDVDEIISILDGTPYDRFDVRTPRLKVSLVRSGEGWTQEWHHAPKEDAPQVLADTAPTPVKEAVAEEPGVVVVRPPLPGAFYRASKPGADPFVEVGSRVEPETVIGIIETMKVMNSVTAGVAGTVIEIVPTDGEMVATVDVLLRVRTEQ